MTICGMVVGRSIFLVLAVLPRLTSGEFDVLAGYTPVSDVVDQSEIDLDQAALLDCLTNLDDAGFACAYEAYSVGVNSSTNSSTQSSTRTIQGFSTQAMDTFAGEELYEIYANYWQDGAYADTFTSSACLGTGDFVGTLPIVRKECCKKGSAYLNVWMFVVHQMELAIDACNIGNNGTTDDSGPHIWDEAWAYYTGSLEGTAGTEDGVLLYNLANKRCANFAVCDGDDDGDPLLGTANVNSEILWLFKEGSSLLLSGECLNVVAIKNSIVTQMTIPLLQGLLRYFYFADPFGFNQREDSEKYRAELWAFSASVLPRINACNTQVADAIYKNSFVGSESAPVPDGYMAMKEALQSVYPCLNVSCDWVGGLVIPENLVYYEGFEPCNDSAILQALEESAGGGVDSSLGGGGDGLLALAMSLSVTVAALGVTGLCVWRHRRRKASASAMTVVQVNLPFQTPRSEQKSHTDAIGI